MDPMAPLDFGDIDLNEISDVVKDESCDGTFQGAIGPNIIVRIF